MNMKPFPMCEVNPDHCSVQVAEEETSSSWTPVRCVWGHDWEPGDLHDPSPAAASSPAESRLSALPAGPRPPHHSARPGPVVLLRHTPKEEAHPLLPQPGALLSSLHVLPLHRGDFTLRGCQPAAGVCRDLWDDSHFSFSHPHQARPRVCDRCSAWSAQPQDEGCRGRRTSVSRRTTSHREMEHVSGVQNNATPTSRTLQNLWVLCSAPGPPLCLVGLIWNPWSCIFSVSADVTRGWIWWKYRKH